MNCWDDLERLDLPESRFAPPPKLENVFSKANLGQHYALQLRYRSRLRFLEDGWSLLSLARQGNYDAQQLYAHRVFWWSLKPHPSPYMLAPDQRQHIDKVVRDVKGSGWLWICSSPKETQRIRVFASVPAGAPPFAGPVLAVDLWEHAYLPDWSIDRGEYLKVIFRHLRWDALDWTHARAVPQSNPSSW